MKMCTTLYREVQIVETCLLHLHQSLHGEEERHCWGGEADRSGNARSKSPSLPPQWRGFESVDTLGRPSVSFVAATACYMLLVQALLLFLRQTSAGRIAGGGGIF